MSKDLVPDLKGSNARWCLHVLPLGDLQELKTSQQHSLIRRKGWCLGCQLWGRLSSPLLSSSRNSWISCFMAALQRGRGDSILISFAFMLRSRSLFIRLNSNKARGESVWRRGLYLGEIYCPIQPLFGQQLHLGEWQTEGTRFSPWQKIPVGPAAPLRMRLFHMDWSGQWRDSTIDVFPLCHTTTS